MTHTITLTPEQASLLNKLIAEARAGYVGSVSAQTWEEHLKPLVDALTAVTYWVNA